MPGDDRRKLGKIQLERRLGPRPDGTPPSSTTRAKEPPPASAPALGADAASPGIPNVDLAQVVIAAEHLEVLPRPAAEALGMLPLLVRDDVVVVAMANPRDRRAIDELEFATGKTVSPRVASQESLTATIAAAYDAAERGETQYRGPGAPPSSPGRPQSRR
jgi:hypothetical protein